MRVTSVVTPLVAALLVSQVAGCGAGTSSFCSTLTNSRSDFTHLQEPAKELSALDDVLAQLAPKDRSLVAPVREYAQILYGRTKLSDQDKLTFLQHFFHVDAPKLDRRLRKECNVPLDKHISLFENPNPKGT